MFAVPREQEVHPVDSRTRDMKGVVGRLLRHDRLPQQFLCQCGHLLINIQEWEPFQQIQPLACHFRIATPYLIQHDLGAKQIVLMPVKIPPFVRQFLTGHLDNIAGSVRDELARDRRLNEYRFRHLHRSISTQVSVHREPASDRVVRLARSGDAVNDRHIPTSRLHGLFPCSQRRSLTASIAHRTKAPTATATAVV